MPLSVGIPDAMGEQAIQMGKVGIAVDEGAQPFAIVLARPLAVPRLPPRIVGVEVQAAERLPAAMVTTFDVDLLRDGARRWAGRNPGMV